MSFKNMRELLARLLLLLLLIGLEAVLGVSGSPSTFPNDTRGVNVNTLYFNWIVVIAIKIAAPMPDSLWF
jgi:hypothetical protein